MTIALIGLPTDVNSNFLHGPANVVEFNPDRDIHGMTASVAAKLVRELAALASRSPL